MGRRNVEREKIWRGGLLNNVGGLIVGRRSVKSGGRLKVGRGGEKHWRSIYFVEEKC